MLGFGKTTKGPLADAKAAAHWLSSLPANDPIKVQKEVLAELGKLAERTARRTPAGLEAVFVVDTHAKGIVRSLIAQYTLPANRSPKIENHIWRALYELTQGFQVCYAAFGREISDRVQHSKWQALLPELLGRQIIHLALDAKLRLYRCERWIPAKWAELHALFTRACAHQVERYPLTPDPRRGATTIEHQYVVALVLQLVDPGDLKPRQIEWVANQLDDWCRPLRLTVEPRSPTTFYLNLAGSSGLRRRPLGAIEGRVLFLDTEPLHMQLVQNRAALERTVRSSPLPADAREQRDQLELFVKLANRTDPEFKPLARRGQRAPAKGAVDAIVGLTNITAFLHVDPLLPAGPHTASRSFGDTMELAVFGRTRTDPDHREEVDRRRVAAHAMPGGPWEIKDASSSGFRLDAPMSAASEVTLGMLVAIHRHGQDGWIMGIVRRMRRLSANQAEIGLQLIATAFASADLEELPRERDAEGTGGAEQTAVGGRRFQGLQLSFERHAGEPAVHSLIIPPPEYQPARRCTLTTPTSARAIRFGRLLEQQTDWIWTVIEPLERGAAADIGPAA